MVILVYFGMGLVIYFGLRFMLIDIIVAGLKAYKKSETEEIDRIMNR